MTVAYVYETATAAAAAVITMTTSSGAISDQRPEEHLVTAPSRLPVNSSQTRLITQSTRHKRAHQNHQYTSRNHLHAVSLRRHPETVLNTDGVITAICVTLMISLIVQGQKVQKMYTADSRSRRQITLLRKARSTRHNAVKHDGQLVTRFYDVTS